jgi:hypothetical protein
MGTAQRSRHPRLVEPHFGTTDGKPQFHSGWTLAYGAEIPLRGGCALPKGEPILKVRRNQ